MFGNRSSRFKAVLQALTVTVLWSTSWVFIKIGLRGIPALPFAGLRYTLAFVCLLPVALRAGRLKPLRHLTRGGWLRLAALGLTFYAVTQGAQYLSLFYLPAVHVSLLLSFSAVVVALLGIAFLEERPTATQWGGTLLYLAGVLIFFYPLMLPAGSAVGLLIASLGVVANAVSSILGRQINRARDLEPLGVTVVSMGIGGPLLLLVGVAAHGLPRLEPLGWLLVAWLALVNSALAFTLWNHTLRTLSAVESSIINNTMLFQIALLAWVFLGEGLAARQIAGTMVAGAGTLIVQLSGRSSIATRRCPPSRRAHSAADNQS